MVEALEEVRKIDPNTLFYGEGWDFGEVADNARFDQANQINMAGTEIGTFSDRLRDAVRGGSPFDGGVDSEGNHPLRFNQGFGNAAIANEETKVDQDSINGRLHNQDLVRLGMAGNLAEYVLIDYKGDTKLGKTSITTVRPLVTPKCLQRTSLTFQNTITKRFGITTLTRSLQVLALQSVLACSRYRFLP